MSLRPHLPELDAEQEIQLGRYWCAIVRRWWAPVLGIVAGAVLGLLVRVGSSQTWRATAQVYLGQALAPGGSVAVSPVPTVLGLVENLVTSANTIESVAKRVGLRPGQLSGRISTKPISSVSGNTKLTTPAPLIAITVQGRPGSKLADAANALADVVIRSVSGYAGRKLAALRDELAYDGSQLTALNDRLAVAQANKQQVLRDKSIAATDKLVAIANLNDAVKTALGQHNALEQDRFTVRQQLALVHDIETGRLVTPAVSSTVAAPSKQAGAAVGAVIGLIVGLLVALFWDPVAARLEARPQ